MLCMFTILNMLTLNVASSFTNMMSNESSLPVQKHKHHMVSLTGEIKKKQLNLTISEENAGCKEMLGTMPNFS